LIPADGYQTLSIPLVMPQLAPDTYLVGLLVTPLNDQPNVRVVSAIGSYATIDVPGPRDRHLTATLHTPGIVWGASHKITLVATNTGRSSLWFWGEHGAQRIPRLLVPAGHHRTLSLAAHAAFGLGIKHVRVRLFYNRSDAQVVQLTAQRTILFVHPGYGAAAVALIVLAIAAVLRLRRHPRQSRRSKRARRRSRAQRRARARTPTRHRVRV
jgi:hypothetical protein